MGQAGSAQREPSMEEILASIRRIIQDSDSIQQPLEAEPAFDTKASVEPRAADEGGAGEVEAFRAGLDEPAAAPPSMAEIQAEVSRASPEPAAPTAQIRPLRPSASEEMKDAPTLDIAPVEDEGEAGDPPAGDVAAETPPIIADEGATGGVTFAASAASAQQDPAPGPAAGEIRPAIISDHAGRQVAASFGELSEAFAASRRRSFDDMAQEMLRPMLQDWLDNNLPTLVERLVREEIERVARGS